MKYFYSSLFYILFLYNFSTYSSAQEANTFNLNIDNGLPSNLVYDVIVDTHGYLWTTTPKGIARYNGYDFKFFNLAEGLPYEDIWSLVEDKKGRIWLGTISSDIGYIYNSKYHKAVFQNLKGTIYPRGLQAWKSGITFYSSYVSGRTDITICIADNDTIKALKIKTNIFKDGDKKNEDYHPPDLFSTEHGAFLFFYNHVVYKIDPDKDDSARPVLNINQHTLDIFSHNATHVGVGNYICIYNLYYIKSNKFACYNFLNGSLDEINLDKYNEQENIEYIYPDFENHKLLVITKSSIYTFDVGEKITYERSYSINRQMLNNNTDGSLIKIIRNFPFWKMVTSTTNKGLFINYKSPNNFIKKGNNDFDHYKYVGGIVDKAQYWWDATSGKLLEMLSNEKMTKYKVNNIQRLDKVVFYSGNTVLIAGSPYYIHNINSNKFYNIAGSKKTPVSLSLIVDSVKNIYQVNSLGFYYLDSLALTNKDKSAYFNNPTKYIDEDRYKCIVYDSLRKNYWAYNDNKICIYNKRQTYTISSKQLTQFGIEKIATIAFDNHFGNIFFKGQNNITIYDPEKNIHKELFNNFNLKESSIYVYRDKLITIGKFGVIFNKILAKDSLSGFLLYPNVKNVNYNFVTDCQISWGKILLNTDKGAYEIVIPNDSEIINCSNDSISIQYKFILNYKDSTFNLVSNDTIHISQENLRLQFDVINPYGNGQLKYTYKLPGDSIGHDLNANELTLPYLQPDNYYILTLNAHDNVWRSHNLTLYLYISPYWWQTHSGRKIIWICSILFIIFLFAIAVLITRKLVLRANQKKNIQMELELKSIYSQINPHFIFNTLNSALLLVSKNRMEEAYVHIAKFSKLLRSYIKSSRNKLITLPEEIVNLKNYIELQQTRFKNKFEYSIDVDERLNIGQIKIPSLLLQPFVENAINHGILNKQSPGNLKIVFKSSEKQNEIICIIEDDGVGRKTSKQINESNTEKDESYGNLMIKDLVSIFNKYEQMNIEITYLDKEYPLTGTTVTIKIK